MKNSHCTDVVIVGGGLAGIMASLRLSQSGVKCILIDDCIPAANGQLGGFAAFSGAKFSLPPAGMGLVPLVGSEGTLNQKISEVLKCLGVEAKLQVDSYEDVSGQLELDGSTTLRRYHSMLHTPLEMCRLLEALTKRVANECILIRANCTSITKYGDGWKVTAQSNNQAEEINVISGTIFFAGGRRSSELMINAGAIPTTGKGLDIGIRIEVLNIKALSGLRALGPDAKIIRGSCRTFCLNVPGLIYHYPFKNLSIPGGIVADKSIRQANVGLLVRVNDKYERLRNILNSADNKIAGGDCVIMSTLPFGEMKECVTKVVGEDVVQQLQEFCHMLGKLELIDWKHPYKIHFPLLDWHWETFAKEASHKTSLDGVYVLGDSAGHARGLLQAAVGGWIAAEEYLL